MAKKTTLDIIVRYNNFPKLLKQIPDEVDAIVQKTALNIEARAKTKAPVRTGFLKNSIRAVNTGTGRAEVRVGAHYGVYVEYGARGRPPRPYLTPAAREEEKVYIDTLSNLEKFLKS